MMTVKQSSNPIDINDHEIILKTAEPLSPSVFNYLHSIIAIPLIYLCTAFMGTLSLIISLFDSNGRKQHWCAQGWSRMIVRIAGVNLRVHGLEHIKSNQSYVFLSSHQSYMDIPVMLGYIPAQLRIAAKKELFKIPFLGWHLKRAGHLAIDRNSSAEAIATLKQAVNGIRGGICAFIFPEGTRSPDGILHPFKKGGFKLALQAQLPIIPVTILGSRQVLPRDSIIFRYGTIDMYIDAPIPTHNLTDADLPSLMNQVRSTIAKHFKEHQA
jgi:1-acyl-sn-glycerol-3-phosphate acyltransferase